MIETLITVAMWGVIAAVLALVALGLLGLYVVKKHPAAYDPARNAARFTMPAMILFVLSCVGVLAFVVCLITAGLIALAT